ncbi:spidroin-1-like [Danaus plexippus]|uniref:spidroin-1-like n=1 Tax=Danaus plexippus TaxID=13037 RepID=UPI002AAF801A|nr:spidroin-1-like [Danaus plexippus]
MFKATLLVCAQALFVQSIAGQCLGAGFGPLAAELPLSSANWAGMSAGPCGAAGLFDGSWSAAGGPFYGAGYGPAAASASHGALPVSSASMIPPSGVSVRSDNAIEGPLAVSGALPFLGTVALEGALPTAGAGAVAYGAGNGEVAMLSEDIGADGFNSLAGGLGYGAGALSYGAGGLGYGAGALGYGAGALGYGAGALGYGAGALGLAAGPLGYNGALSGLGYARAGCGCGSPEQPADGLPDGGSTVAHGHSQSRFADVLPPLIGEEGEQKIGKGGKSCKAKSTSSITKSTSSITKSTSSITKTTSQGVESIGADIFRQHGDFSVTGSVSHCTSTSGGQSAFQSYGSQEWQSTGDCERSFDGVVKLHERQKRQQVRNQHHRRDHRRQTKNRQRDQQHRKDQQTYQPSWQKTEEAQRREDRNQLQDTNAYSQCLNNVYGAGLAYPGAYGLEAGLAGAYGLEAGLAGAYGLEAGLAGPFALDAGLAPAAFGYPAAGLAGAYGGAGIGDIAVAGEMPVAGTTLVAGQVPILGAVRFAGDLPAAGTVSITGGSACGCGRYL